MEERKELEETNIAKSVVSVVQEYKLSPFLKTVYGLKELKDVLHDFQLMAEGKSSKRKTTKKASDGQDIYNRNKNEQVDHGKYIKAPELIEKRSNSSNSMVALRRAKTRENKFFKMESDHFSNADLLKEPSRQSRGGRISRNNSERNSSKKKHLKAAEFDVKNGRSDHSFEGGESLESDEDDQSYDGYRKDKLKTKIQKSDFNSQESEEESDWLDEESDDSEESSSTYSDEDSDDEDSEDEDSEEDNYSSKLKTAEAKHNNPLKTRKVDHEEIELYFEEQSDESSIFDPMETIQKNENNSSIEFEENNIATKIIKKFTKTIKYENLDIIDRFIKDLIEEYTAQDNINYDQFYIIDEDQNKITHLFEILCQGMLCPSLVKFLVLRKPENSDMFYLINTVDKFDESENPNQVNDSFDNPIPNSNDYKLIMATLGLVLGDYSSFYNN